MSLPRPLIADRVTTAERLAHAVLLVGHGTRDLDGTRHFFELSERLSDCLAASARVFPALLEFQSPTIEEAWRELASENPERVTVAPLLLFAAGHAKSDIPGAIESASAAFPTQSPCVIDHCRPISRQSAMVAAVRERLSETLGDPKVAARTPTAVVMVGRGSHDPCASSDMRLMSEVAIFGRGGPEAESIATRYRLSPRDVSTTFYAMAEPRLTQTLPSVAASGRFERIVVHPHLLLSGRLHDAIVSQTRAVAQEFPDVRFDVSDCLGPSDWVARAIAARIEGR